MRKEKTEHSARLPFAASMLIFGTIGLLRRFIDLPSGVIACFRGLLGCVLLLLLQRLGGKKPGLAAIRKSLLPLLISGGMIGFNWMLLFEAYRYTSIAVATLCYYTAPVMLILASPFVFHERLTWRQLVCVGLAACGMVLVSGVLDGGTLPDKSAVVSTVVTSLMARRVCEANGVLYGESFTGFRFIAERMGELERDGYVSLLGFEESYGYMVGSHCRDKDAVTASLLIAEMAAYYEKEGLTLFGAMERLYEKYGSFAERTLNIRFPGVDGLEAMRVLMSDLRRTPPTEIGGTAVTAVRDYQEGTRRSPDGKTEKMALSGSNVLYFELADGCAFVIRPSGTEPKIKIYLLAQADSRSEATGQIERYAAEAKRLPRTDD